MTYVDVFDGKYMYRVYAVFTFLFSVLIVGTRRVIIKGTTEQITLAKSMIEEKVMEDIEMRERIHESLEKRSPRKRTGLQCLMSAEAVEVSWVMSKPQGPSDSRSLLSLCAQFQMAHCMILKICLNGLLGKCQQVICFTVPMSKSH
jgi:hypothetical protein